MVTCTGCSKRSFCKTLCARAKRHANRDWVSASGHEVLLDPKLMIVLISAGRGSRLAELQQATIPSGREFDYSFLTPSQRRAFLLHHRKGMSFRRIGRRMGVSHSRAARLVKRAEVVIVKRLGKNRASRRG